MKPEIKDFLPGYRVNEYLLVISPHKELWERIMKVKEEFSETYQSDHGRWGKPQITLANFVQYAMMEERIINRLRNVAMGHYPFKVELKDFGSFPSHTLFINVTSKVPVQSLVKSIRTETQRLMRLNDDNKPHFILEPHVTIARKLQPWQYEKGWLEYSNKTFTGRFIADSMTLLRRPVGESDSYRMKYQVVNRFEFQNMPVLTKQGELFG
jgi:2'-5' RNA ligase